MVGGHGVVHVDGALRGAGGAGREVQQGHVLGLGGRDLPVRRGFPHEGGQVQGSGFGIAVGVDQQDVPQVRELPAELGDLPAVQRPGGDQRPAGAQHEALPHGLGAERGEQRAEHARVLERAEHGDVQGRPAAGEGEDPFAAADAEAAQDPGEAVGLFGEFGVAQRMGAAVGPDEPQGLPAGAAAGRVPVHRLVGDVEAAAPGESGQGAAGLIPGEGRARRVIIHQVRPDPETADVFGDRRPAGGWFGSCRHGSIGLPPCRCRQDPCSRPAGSGRRGADIWGPAGNPAPASH